MPKTTCPKCGKDKLSLLRPRYECRYCLITFPAKTTVSTNEARAAREAAIATLRRTYKFGTPHTKKWMKKWIDEHYPEEVGMNNEEALFSVLDIENEKRIEREGVLKKIREEKQHWVDVDPLNDRICILDKLITWLLLKD